MTAGVSARALHLRAASDGGAATAHRALYARRQKAAENGHCVCHLFRTGAFQRCAFLTSRNANICSVPAYRMSSRTAV